MRKFLMLLASSVALSSILTNSLAGDDKGQLVLSYAVKGNQKQWQIDQFGNKTTYNYNSHGQLAEATIDGILGVEYDYAANGDIQATRDALGRATSCKYDQHGRPLEITNSLGLVSKLTYDKYGRKIERSGAGEYPLKLTYTSWGELAGYTDGNGSNTKFEYGQHGKLTKRIWPDGKPVHYGYDNGRLVSKEEAGRKTTYKYNEFGRMIEEKITQGDQTLTTEMTYDEGGRMTSISDGKTTVKFTYDRFGRKLTEAGPIGIVTNRYDNQGRLVARQVQFNGNSDQFLTEYSYDEYNRIVSVKSSSGTFNYTWTKDNKVATQSVGDKLVKNEYDQAGRLISKTFGDTVLAKYEYDKLNRRAKGQYFDVNWNYTYDQYNQLVGATNSQGDSYAYTYDSIGNRLKAVENDKTHYFTYNKLNQISNDGYAYDAWGNMIQTLEARYRYDLKNRLTEITKVDGTIIHYEYDPLAQRISSIVNDKEKTEFLMSEMVELARNDGKAQYHTIGLDLLGTLEQTGAVGAVLASSDASGTGFNYLYDGNGNVIADCSANGATKGQLAYSPFGRQTAGVKLPFTFSTKTVDTSEMSYYGNRFYNSTIARWTNKDPANEFGGFNLYAFIQNNINLIDRHGLATYPTWSYSPFVTDSDYFYEQVDFTGSWRNDGLTFTKQINFSFNKSITVGTTYSISYSGDFSGSFNVTATRTDSVSFSGTVSRSAAIEKLLFRHEKWQMKKRTAETSWQTNWSSCEPKPCPPEYTDAAPAVTRIICRCYQTCTDREKEKSLATDVYLETSASRYRDVGGNFGTHVSLASLFNTVSAVMKSEAEAYAQSRM